MAFGSIYTRLPSSIVRGDDLPSAHQSEIDNVRRHMPIKLKRSARSYRVLICGSQAVTGLERIEIKVILMETMTCSFARARRIQPVTATNPYRSSITLTDPGSITEAIPCVAFITRIVPLQGFSTRAYRPRGVTLISDPQHQSGHSLNACRQQIRQMHHLQDDPGGR
jgi:hypothetical protein